MATAPSNMFRLAIARGQVDIVGDEFKICLMGSGFVFDPDNHDQWTDVSGWEISSGHGYTQNTKVLSTPPTFGIDNSIDRAYAYWADVAWNASGGSIGPTAGAIIHDTDTVAGNGVLANAILGYIDFGYDITQVSGGNLTIANIRIDI